MQNVRLFAGFGTAKTSNPLWELAETYAGCKAFRGFGGSPKTSKIHMEPNRNLCKMQGFRGFWDTQNTTNPDQTCRSLHELIIWQQGIACCEEMLVADLKYYR